MWNIRKGRHYHRQPTLEGTPSSPLPTIDDNAPKFPWFKVIVLLCINYNESVQAQVIFPFVPFAVAHWGVKEHDIGFYVGVLIASFFFAQLLLVSWWGRLADYYGRRPILLVGLLGTAITMLIFGFATNYSIMQCSSSPEIKTLFSSSRALRPVSTHFESLLSSANCVLVSVAATNGSTSAEMRTTSFRLSMKRRTTDDCTARYSGDSGEKGPGGGKGA